VRPDRSGDVPAPAKAGSGFPAVRWSVSSRSEITDQRVGGGAQTHEDGSRTSLGAVNDSACGFGSFRVCPVSSVQMWCGLAQDLFLRCFVRGAGGGDEETRTPDPLLAKEMLCQLSYVPLPRVMVGASGLEPETSALSGQCSNQLS
jgi:hypothetical protein